MSRYYNKDILKEMITIEGIFDLLELWGGEPEYTDRGLVSQTICHNKPGEGSRKLYFYENTKLCHCFTGCLEPSFDIFDLCIKVMKIQKGLDWELYDAMNYIASYFGFDGIQQEPKDKEKLEDWDVFKRHKFQINQVESIPVLKSYSMDILNKFSYPRIQRWEEEGISDKVSKRNFIGYYPGKEQIVIPHFDINSRLVGIRGRFLAQDMVDKYGKYRPLLVGRQLYNHPLSMNLYHIQVSKDNIGKAKTAILFESEKATLMYESYYGRDNDISVACCGQNLSVHQVNLLRNIGAGELVICFDKDYEQIGDEIFNRTKNKMIHIGKKYGNIIKITVVFDKKNILPRHSSPIDQGKETFESLLNNRFIPRE